MAQYGKKSIVLHPHVRGRIKWNLTQENGDEYVTCT